MAQDAAKKAEAELKVAQDAATDAQNQVKVAETGANEATEAKDKVIYYAGLEEIINKPEIEFETATQSVAKVAKDGSLMAPSTAAMGVVANLSNMVNLQLSKLDIRKSIAPVKVASIASDAFNTSYYYGNQDNYAVFADILGYTSEYDSTGAEIDGVSAIAGVVAYLDNAIYGAFFDYGYGDYDSKSGNGELDAYGLGVLAKLYLDNNFFIDGYAKVGRVDNDYSINIAGQKVDMDLSGTYYSLGASVGHELKLGLVDITNRLGYDYSYIEGGEYTHDFFGTFKYDDVTSHRVRFDTTIAYQASDKFRPYAKGLIEYEFDGDNDTTHYKGTYSRTFGVAGDGVTGGVGLGFTYRPNSSTVLELGAEQLFGERDETSAKLGVAFSF